MSARQIIEAETWNCPVWNRPAWRGDMGTSVPSNLSVWDAVAYEQEELGNDNQVDPALEPKLKNLSVRHSLWVADSKHYGSGMPGAFGTMRPVKLPASPTYVIGQDGEGGYLLVNPKERLW